MGYEELLAKLDEHPREESLELVRLLIKIAENILSNPTNVHIRTLKKSNPTISTKVLKINEGAMCLKQMGFQETEALFVLPFEASLRNVSDGKDALVMWKESIELVQSSGSVETIASRGPSSVTCKDENSFNHLSSPTSNRSHVTNREIIRPIILPPLNSIYSDPFLHRMEVNFHSCLRYANKDVKQRARKLIPIVTLENYAQKRLRAIQEHVKKNKLSEPNISIQEMLILELLHWFKEDFFSWVNSPDCESCGDKTHFSHMATDKALLVYTDRVELHICGNCQTFTPFARHNDLNILLETRKGRCGEWANVFTLFCVAMGWDARFVVDETDHVWTEVYSIAQKRWLHCDPCENICDKPLIYESGWNKKVTYIIAYSSEEVQDVTWRYSSQHKEVLKRRKLCDEQKLTEVLIELRKKRQISLSNSRKAYLTKRLLLELADMLTEKKPGEEEIQGRQSGDAIWRLARGEIQNNTPTEFVWRIDLTQLVDNIVTIRYSAANDSYEYLEDGVVKNIRQKWSQGCFNYRNIIRKEEKDWKQVYLARRENDGEGRISWRFELGGNAAKLLDKVIVNFNHAVYENGIVEAKIYSGDVCEVIPGDSKSLETSCFSGLRAVTVEAILSGGKGDVAWQHTQLFRQKIDSSDYPFSIMFFFK